ncbi:MAG: hypothetical protein D6746_07175 [Bacteroidetes bacterium]|nr:MAG: hypothetical protein D6746_07175 [Bacteroidota bacterium]
MENKVKSFLYALDELKRMVVRAGSGKVQLCHDGLQYTACIDGLMCTTEVRRDGVLVHHMKNNMNALDVVKGVFYSNRYTIDVVAELVAQQGPDTLPARQAVALQRKASAVLPDPARVTVFHGPHFVTATRTYVAPYSLDHLLALSPPDKVDKPAWEEVVSSYEARLTYKDIYHLRTMKDLLEGTVMIRMNHLAAYSVGGKTYTAVILGTMCYVTEDIDYLFNQHFHNILYK